MATILPILINCLAGSGGGFLSNMLKGNNLGTVGNLAAGALGGGALPAILSAVGMGTTAAAGGGIADMLPGILTAVVGGGAGSLLGGLLKK